MRAFQNIHFRDYGSEPSIIAWFRKDSRQSLGSPTSAESKRVDSASMLISQLGVESGNWGWLMIGQSWKSSNGPSIAVLSLSSFQESLPPNVASLSLCWLIGQLHRGWQFLLVHVNTFHACPPARPASGWSLSTPIRCSCQVVSEKLLEDPVSRQSVAAIIYLSW